MTCYSLVALSGLGTTIKQPPQPTQATPPNQRNSARSAAQKALAPASTTGPAPLSSLDSSNEAAAMLRKSGDKARRATGPKKFDPSNLPLK